MRFSRRSEPDCARPRSRNSCHVAAPRGGMLTDRCAHAGDTPGDANSQRIRRGGTHFAEVETTTHSFYWRQPCFSTLLEPAMSETRWSRSSLVEPNPAPGRSSRLSPSTFSSASRRTRRRRSRARRASCRSTPERRATQALLASTCGRSTDSHERVRMTRSPAPLQAGLQNGASASKNAVGSTIASGGKTPRFISGGGPHDGRAPWREERRWRRPCRPAGRSVRPRRPTRPRAAVAAARDREERRQAVAPRVDDLAARSRPASSPACRRPRAIPPRRRRARARRGPRRSARRGCVSPNRFDARHRHQHARGARRFG